MTTTMIKRAAAAAALALAATAASTTSASADTSPAGCGTPHQVNQTGIYKEWFGSPRVGTLTQYWGWCNGELRNWAHVHFQDGVRAWNTKVSIQTRDGVKHGVFVAEYGRDFTSKPSATMDRDTRARVEGTIMTSQDEPIKVATTGWSG